MLLLLIRTLKYSKNAKLHLAPGEKEACIVWRHRTAPCANDFWSHSSWHWIHSGCWILCTGWRSGMKCYWPCCYYFIPDSCCCICICRPLLCRTWGPRPKSVRRMCTAMFVLASLWHLLLAGISSRNISLIELRWGYWMLLVLIIQLFGLPIKETIERMEREMMAYFPSCVLMDN